MTVSYTPAASATNLSTGDASSRMTQRAAGRFPRVAAIGLAMAACLPTLVSAQHVHGVIDLGVVIEDEMLAVSIDAPLSDVVGFEHAPANEDQAARLEKVAAILASADAMFGIPASAACSLSDTDITAPAYLQALISGEEAAEVDHHDHDDHDHDHHDHDHDHDDHDHSGDHAEVNATYQWACGSPSELDAIALSFISGFTSVETVRVQLLTADGAQVLNLGSDDTTLPLSRR